MDKKMVHVADIVGIKGLKGELKIKSYTQPLKALLNYVHLYGENGEVILTPMGGYEDSPLLIGKFKESANREQAEHFRNTALYVFRNQLDNASLTTNEYYQADLIGLHVKSNQEIIGSVVSIADFGAGALIEIKLKDQKDTIYIPFTDAYVPVVDINQGFIEVNLQKEAE